MADYNKYRCLKRYSYSYNEYSLRPIILDDIMSIMVWRNEQMEVLRQKELLTEEIQIHYFENVIMPLLEEEKPRQILFSYYEKEELIGYGGLTNIDWEDRHAELSFLVNTELSQEIILYQEKFQMFLQILKDIAFEELMLNRLFTETYDIRPYHIETLENCGFVYEGRMREHVFINEKHVDSLIHGCLRRDEE